MPPGRKGSQKHGLALQHAHTRAKAHCKDAPPNHARLRAAELSHKYLLQQTCIYYDIPKNIICWGSAH